MGYRKLDSMTQCVSSLYIEDDELAEITPKSIRLQAPPRSERAQARRRKGESSRKLLTLQRTAGLRPSWLVVPAMFFIELLIKRQRGHYTAVHDER